MRRGRPRSPDLLTPREQEVLSLLREGLTNEQIASRLGISESGARYHVSEILSKLGVNSRQEAAAWSAGRRGRFGMVLPAFIGRLRFSQTAERVASVGTLAIVAAALLGLAAGVLVMESRSSSGAGGSGNDSQSSSSEDPRLQLLPALPDPLDRMPRPEDVEVAGICDIAVSVHDSTQQVGRITYDGLTVTSRMACPQFIDVQACDPARVTPLSGVSAHYVQVCDEDGFRIDYYHGVFVMPPDGAIDPFPRTQICTGSRPTVFDGGTIAAGATCTIPQGGHYPVPRLEPGLEVVIEVCFHVRFTDSCASFVHRMG